MTRASGCYSWRKQCKMDIPFCGCSRHWSPLQLRAVPLPGCPLLCQGRAGCCQVRCCGWILQHERAFACDSTLSRAGVSSCGRSAQLHCAVLEGRKEANPWRQRAEGLPGRRATPPHQPLTTGSRTSTGVRLATVFPRLVSSYCPRTWFHPCSSRVLQLLLQFLLQDEKRDQSPGCVFPLQETIGECNHFYLACISLNNYKPFSFEEPGW